MGGTTIFGALFIGIVLVLGQRYFPDNVVMWFASSDDMVALWRDGLVVGLIALAVVREYYHNLYLHILWGTIAAGLAWMGGTYFLSNPSHVFDVLLFFSAGLAFATSALAPCTEPVRLRHLFEALLPNRVSMYYQKSPDSVDQFAGWRYIADGKEITHRLVLGERLDRTQSI